MAENKIGAGSKKRTRTAMIITLLILILLLSVAVFFALTSSKGKPEDEPTDLISQISGYKGYSRTVFQEEFDFYRTAVKRDNPNNDYGAELDAMTRDYANKVNAYFFLGNKFGLCEPYDFSVLKYRMEQENKERQVKLEKGEPIYGPTSYNISTYFQYIYSNLESDILNYIVENADEPIINGAKAYYDADPSAYKELTSVTYKITENGKTETYTLSKTEVNDLQTTDGTLFDFIAEAKSGDTFSYYLQGTQRDVVMVSSEYETLKFEDNMYTVTLNYVSDELIDKLIDTVAGNNPVSFELEE